MAGFTRCGFVLLTLAAVSCAAEPGAVTSAHTDRAYVHGNSPFYWAASDYQSYRQSESGARLGAQPVDADHAVAQRVQTWVDRLDEIVRKSHLEQTGEALRAPRPTAKVLPSKDMLNAFVSPVEGCVMTPFAGSEPLVPPRPAVEGRARMVAQLSRANLRPWVGSTHCIDQPNWHAPELVSFWNDLKPKCSLKIIDGKLAVGAECGSVAPAAVVGLTATAPFVHISSDLIAKISEDAVVVIVAHELAHYYRSHVSPLVKGKYDFWYDQAPGQPVRPVAAANQAELKAAYKELAKAPRALGGPDYEGHFSPRMLSFLLGTVSSQLLERTEAQFVCADARDALGPWVIELKEGSVPSPEALASYRGYEKALTTCSSQLALGEAGSHSLSAGALLFGAKSEGPSETVTMQLGDNLLNFLERLDRDARNLDDKAERLYRRLKDNHIGWYTTEQEADEVALDLATKAGLSPERVLAGWLDFMTVIDAKMVARLSPGSLQRRRDNGDIDPVACKALLDAGWTTTDDAGRTRSAHVSLGSLFDSHHASCYRLYRLWSEAKAHSYAAAEGYDELSPSWDHLQEQARWLSDPYTAVQVCFDDPARDAASCQACVKERHASGYASYSRIYRDNCECQLDCAEACSGVCSDSVTEEAACTSCTAGLTAESACMPAFTSACDDDPKCRYLRNTLKRCSL